MLGKVYKILFWSINILIYANKVLVFPSESDLNDSDSECSSGSGKRYRTSLTPKQLHCLVTAYEKNSKPSRDTRRRLSRELRLDYRVIQVWFQNKRAKCKNSPRFNHQFQQNTMATAGFSHNRFCHGKNNILNGNTPYIRRNMEIDGVKMKLFTHSQRREMCVIAYLIFLCFFFFNINVEIFDSVFLTFSFSSFVFCWTISQFADNWQRSFEYFNTLNWKYGKHQS